MEQRKPTIDEIEKILNSDGPPITINTDGSIRSLTNEEIAEQDRQERQYKDDLIVRLSEENRLLKSALKTLTQKW